MTKFYALGQTKDNKSVVVSLEETIYHKAQNEAEDIAKKGGFRLQDIRSYRNGQKQPETLSKGNVLRPHHIQQKRKKG